MAAKLGILAGGGALPGQIVSTCEASGRAFYVVALQGHAAAELARHGSAARLGAAGTILKRLRAAGVEEVVMAGHVRRPTLAELRPDWRAVRFFAALGPQALDPQGLGDDGLLRAIGELLREEGFRPVGVQDIVGDLLTPAGPLGGLAPDATAQRDIKIGLQAARAHGARDAGQAVVVQEGVVIALEGEAGTDALICGVAPAARAVLVKAAKPQQDLRFDLPAIGPDTVARAAAAGFAGIALEAGRTLTLQRDQVAAAADRAGLFVVGV